MIRVLIVDDHAVVREGLKSAFTIADLEVVGAAATVAEAIAQIAHTNPDVVVVDLNLPDGSGFEIVQWIRSISKEIGVVILTLNSGPEFIAAAMKSGANSFVVKNAPTSEIVSAIKHCISSPRGFSAKGLSAFESSTDRLLTARELDVIMKISLGLSNQDIAKQLFLSQSTVKSHITSIFRKFNVDNRVSAINFARENGLLLK
jgi:DNA-binding NarL/FixJ family response regulator